MKCQITLCLVVALHLLSGCVSTTSSSQNELASQSIFESKENMLIKAGSKGQLIQLYKDDLKKKDSQKTRIKLIEAYLAEQDYESAAFHLDTFQRKERPKQDNQIYGKETLENKATVAFLKAKIALAQGKPEEATALVNNALILKGSYPEAENLMGLIQADMGNYKEARFYFSEARRNYYDDVIVKNNLAVLDLIEEDYQAAVEKLQPLYLKGLADEKVAANLVVAYTKLGNYNAVEEILKKQGYSIDEAQSVFIGLKISNNTVEKRRQTVSIAGMNTVQSETLPVKKEVVSNETDD